MWARNAWNERLKRARAKRAWKDTVLDAMEGAAADWESLSEAEREALMPDRSSHEDLTAVRCNTHKESDEAVRDLAKTAGILCACLSSGIIVLTREMYGCESLSQRYLFVSALQAAYPDLKILVHDDACHLQIFCQARSSSSAVAACLAPPQLLYACDGFHMAAHVDAWFLAHCSPKAPHFHAALRDVRTSVCEFTFTWLSQYKNQTKHMSEFGFKFFSLEMVDAHNNEIFEGRQQHLTFRRA